MQSETVRRAGAAALNIRIRERVRGLQHTGAQHNDIVFGRDLLHSGQ